jgi:hypothetical protein
MKNILNNEKGQAIVEMAVCMVAIMVVFLAVIFAFAIGSTNIDNLLTCRGNADNYSYSQVYGGASQQINTWTEGIDGRMYTNDDVAETGTNDAPELFKGELKNDSVDLVNSFGGGYVENNFAADFADSNAVFLTAADLTSYSLLSDPYETMNIEDLRGAFSALLFSSDLYVYNSVHMPFMNTETEEGAE